MEIKINYHEVISRARSMRRRLETTLRETDGGYMHINRSLSRMDSRTNAAVEEAVATNHEKGEVCVETLIRILNVMENSAIMTEEQDRELARIFRMGGVQ